MRTLRGAWEIVQETVRPNVGLVVDCVHIYVGGGLIEEIDDIDSNYLFTFHLDDLED